MDAHWVCRRDLARSGHAAGYPGSGGHPPPGVPRRLEQEGYDSLRPFIAYIHVKDALLGSGQVVPAGQGDGEIRETIAALRASGFDGFFSLEPHLAAAGTFSGFSGPGLFRMAVKSFKGLLREQRIEWG